MKFMTTLLIIGLLAWGCALAWFIGMIPNEPTAPTLKTDAIVVLTGGNARVERGFEMLADGAAPLLFISGVGKEVTLPQMIAAHATPAQREQIKAKGATIVLGYLASSTQTNAEEVAAFVRTHDVHSIRLVTAHYHMPRSRLEFRHALPGVTVVADPVFPDDFHADAWWSHDKTRRLLFSEFYKYYAVLFTRG